MNESQSNFNLEFNDNDYISQQQDLSSNLEDYNQDLLNDSMQSEQSFEQSWEQPDQTDYSQQDWNANQEFDYSNYNESDMVNTSFSSGIEESNMGYGDNQNLSSVYEQSDYSLDSNVYEDVSNTQDYNDNLWEQQYQEQSVMSSGDVTSSEQRSGHEPTAEDLAKSDSLRDDAHQQDLKYQSESDWTEFYDKHDNDGMADLHNKWAGQHLQKQEELLKEANKLEGKE